MNFREMYADFRRGLRVTPAQEQIGQESLVGKLIDKSYKTWPAWIVVVGDEGKKVDGQEVVDGVVYYAHWHTQYRDGQSVQLSKESALQDVYDNPGGIIDRESGVWQQICADYPDVEALVFPDVS